MTRVEPSALDLLERFQTHFIRQRRDFVARFDRFVERRQAAGHSCDDADPVAGASLLPRAPHLRRSSA